MCASLNSNFKLMILMESGITTMQKQEKKNSNNFDNFKMCNSLLRRNVRNTRAIWKKHTVKGKNVDRKVHCAFFSDVDWIVISYARACVCEWWAKKMKRKFSDFSFYFFSLLHHQNIQCDARPHFKNYVFNEVKECQWTSLAMLCFKHTNEWTIQVVRSSLPPKAFRPALEFKC